MAAAEPAADLALVVCTYRRPGCLLRLLESVAAQLRMPAEVLVVDGSPDDATERAIAQSPLASTLPMRYLRTAPEDRGLTRQRNVGIAETSAPFVAFLDDDTVPEPRYLAEVLACFDRHDSAVGVGGFLTDIEWRQERPGASLASGRYRSGEWSRREGFRWRLRRRLGLDSPLPPGWMPASGHGRSLGYLPPNSGDHRVEFIMGGAATWRRSLLDRVAFCHFFEGYGLYEDLDFSLRTHGRGSLYLAANARLAHLHEPSGRPRPWHYGAMVTRNGWRVWRTRWSRPALPDRARWWLTTLLLAGCRLGDAVRGPDRLRALVETAGRLAGAAGVLVRPPPLEDGRG